MHSIFRYLSQLAQRQEVPSTLRSVHLVLVSRTPGIAHVFKESINEILGLSVPGISFSATMYLTGPDAPLSAKMTLVKGRPDFQELYEQALASVGATGRVLVKLCAPAVMDASAAKAARGMSRITYESE